MTVTTPAALTAIWWRRDRSFVAPDWSGVELTSGRKPAHVPVMSSRVIGARLDRSSEWLSAVRR